MQILKGPRARTPSPSIDGKGVDCYSQDLGSGSADTALLIDDCRPRNKGENREEQMGQMFFFFFTCFTLPISRVRKREEIMIFKLKLGSYIKSWMNFHKSKDRIDMMGKQKLGPAFYLLVAINKYL